MNLPAALVDLYITIIPFLEVAIALALITGFKRRLFVVVWVVYFMSLEFGHYVLEEFNSVDLIISIILFGIVDYILPAYEPSWLKSKSE